MGLIQAGKLRQAGEAELGTGPGARAWGGCETSAGMAAPQSSPGLCRVQKNPLPKLLFGPGAKKSSQVGFVGEPGVPWEKHPEDFG